MLRQLIKKIGAAEALSAEDISQAVGELIRQEVSCEVKAEFLIELSRKGETTEEIAGFARALREKAVPVPLDAGTRAGVILDVVGTGGDHLSTFNISTTVALIAASAGITVAKHGNRAITSQTGSADVIESLGIKADMSPEEAARCLEEHHFAFLFAPRYHPAFKEIGAARRLCAERGQRTIFNYLGPLLNPVRPSVHLIGVPRPQLCEPMAQVLQTLGALRAMVVCGSVPASDGFPIRFLDELSPLGTNYIAEFYQENALGSCTLEPRCFPVGPAALSDLRGGDRHVNAEIIRQLLSGKDRGAKRDAVLLNAAGALFVAGKCRSMIEGWEVAAELIDSGKAMSKLMALSKVG